MQPHSPRHGRFFKGLVIFGLAVMAVLCVWFVLEIEQGTGRSGSLDSQDATPRTSDSRSNRQEDLRRLLGHWSQLMERGNVTISGTVRAAGHNLSDAEVELTDGSARFTGRTDSTGHYSVSVPVGSYQLAARAEGYISTTRAVIDRRNGFPSLTNSDALGSGDHPMLVANSDRVGVDIELSPGASVTGTVRNAAGALQKDVLVSAFSIDYSTGQPAPLRAATRTSLALTDASGAFTLDVPPGEVVVRASRQTAPNQPQAVRPVYLAPGGRQQVDLTLEEVCTVSGRVVDDRGQPVQEGTLEVSALKGDHLAFRPRGYFEGSRFTYTHDKPGLFYLRVWPWRSEPSPPIELDCQPGSALSDVVVEVPKGEPNLSGVVLDQDGNPVANAYVDVIAQDPDMQSQQERTDSRGRFEVYLLEPGDYRVSALVEGLGVGLLETRSPGEGIELRLQGTGSIQGTVDNMDSGYLSITIGDLLYSKGSGTFALPGQIHQASIQKTVPVVNGRFRLDNIPACLVIGEVIGRSGAATFQVAVETDRASQVQLSLSDRVTAPGNIEDLL